MKYYLIAGEISGDIHGANLMKGILKQDPNASFRFFGGDRMKEVSPKGLAMHISNLSFMGFIEVAFNLKTILTNIAFCKRDLETFKPDVVIFIDFPGFNLRIAKFTSTLKIKSFYYISPQIWAWKEGRIKTIKRYIDEMYVILPFEVDFYLKHKLKAHFFGNPVLDEVLNKQKQLTQISEQEKQKKKQVAILPGSRTQEMTRLLPMMMEACKHFPQYNFVIPAVKSHPISFYEQYIPKEINVAVKYDAFDEIMQDSIFALVTSGTATLQTALHDVPQVVCYMAHSVSYYIAKKLVNLDFISLPNLILNRQVVTELIQKECNPKRLVEEIRKLESENYQLKIKDHYKKIRSLLGNGNASDKIAQHMYNTLQVSV